jgi:hypothetical protein
MQNAVPVADDDHAGGEMVKRRTQCPDLQLFEVHEIADRNGPADVWCQEPQNGDFPIGYGTHGLVAIRREDADAARFTQHHRLD